MAKNRSGLIPILIACFTLCVLLQGARADFLQSGLNLITGGNSANGESNALRDNALPYFFNMLSKTSFKEFPFEGGRLTNINVQVIPPQNFDKVNVDVLSDTLFFKIGGMGAKIGADFEVTIKKRPATGHIDIDITDLGVDLKLRNQNGEGLGDRKVGADIKLDLEHTHSDIKLTTEGNVEEIKNYLIGLVTNEVKNSLAPDWAKSIKFWNAAKNHGPIHHAMKRRTQEVIDQYYKSLEIDDKVNTLDTDLAYKVGKPNRIQDFGTYVLSKPSNTLSIKERLNRKGNKLFSSRSIGKSSGLRKGLLSEAGHIDSHTNLPVMEYSVTPESYTKFFLKSSSDQPVLSKDMIRNLLKKDSGINNKVENYFGGKVRFNCTPKNVDPLLKSSDQDSIVGTFTLNCALQSDSKQEPLYNMELDLEFTIHPDAKSENGSNPEFGDFVSVNAEGNEKGDLKTSIQISDQPPQELMMFDPMEMWGDLFGMLEQEQQWGL